MTQYLPKAFESFGGDINVKVDLSNFATRIDLKMQEELMHLNQMQNLIQSV